MAPTPHVLMVILAFAAVGAQVITSGGLRVELRAGGVVGAIRDAGDASYFSFLPNVTAARGERGALPS